MLQAGGFHPQESVEGAMTSDESTDATQTVTQTATNSGKRPMTMIVGDKYWCNVCEIGFSQQSLLQAHIDGKKHKRAFKLGDTEYEPHDPESLGPVKKKKVQHAPFQIPKRGSSLYGSLPMTVFKGDKYWCNVCQVSTDGEQSLTDHVQGKKHESKLKTVGVGAFVPYEIQWPPPQLKEKPRGGGAMLMKGRHAYAKHMGGAHSTAVSKPFAHVAPMGGATPMAGAVSGVDGAESGDNASGVQDVMSTDKILEVASQYPEIPESRKYPQFEKSKHSCDVCQLWFYDDATLKIHLAGKKHEKKVKSQGSFDPNHPFICLICEFMGVTQEALNSHLDGKNHLKKAGLLKPKDQGTGRFKFNPNHPFICEPCQFMAQDHPMLRTHLEGKAHATRVGLAKPKIRFLQGDITTGAYSTDIAAASTAEPYDCSTPASAYVKNPVVGSLGKSLKPFDPNGKKPQYWNVTAV